MKIITDHAAQEKALAAILNGCTVTEALEAADSTMCSQKVHGAKVGQIWHHVSGRLVEVVEVTETRIFTKYVKNVAKNLPCPWTHDQFWLTCERDFEAETEA